jgi:hypothetical protein
MEKHEFDAIVESVCDKFRVQPEMRALSDNEKYQLKALFDAEVIIVDKKLESAKVEKRRADDPDSPYRGFARG